VRVLVVLDCSSAWSRGTLRGFLRIADEQGWLVHHYDSAADLEQLAAEFPPRAVVLGPPYSGPWPERLRDCVSVSINTDAYGEGVASVCLDEARTGELALSHLMGRGFRNVTTFRSGAWGERRERWFREAAARAGASLEPPWWSEERARLRLEEQPAAIVGWLSSLKRPCGVFALCDAMARLLARFARDANLRIPEDLAIVGVDNDVFQCEVQAPGLSSVAVPWHRFGECAASLVQLGLLGTLSAGRRILVPPVEVITRRSSDAFAVEDPMLMDALTWIGAHSAERLSVSVVSSAVGVKRRTLERRFRSKLGRTVMEEVRRRRVDVARRLLATTGLPLPEIAKQSGFKTATLLSVAFHTEIGLTPGAYRRQAQRMGAVAE
jgi:LacI family transcriptional regulator